MTRFVADLGNTRLKWSRLDDHGRVGHSVSLPSDDPDSWETSWAPGEARWAVASVNPPAAERFGRFLHDHAVTDVRWYASADEVPVRHRLATLKTAGADRALAVFEAVSRKPSGRPGQVVLCGTAVTVECVSAEGVWLGGAIAPGLRLSARALHTQTALLPDVTPAPSPQAWGDATRPAIETGVYWAVVGSIREILGRQATFLGSEPWVVWSGGDAPRLAASVLGEHTDVVPDLVLAGLARVAFGSGRFP